MTKSLPDEAPGVPFLAPPAMRLLQGPPSPLLSCPKCPPPMASSSSFSSSIIIIKVTAYTTIPPQQIHFLHCQCCLPPCLLLLCWNPQGRRLVCTHIGALSVQCLGEFVLFACLFVWCFMVLKPFFEALRIDTMMNEIDEL